MADAQIPKEKEKEAPPARPPATEDLSREIEQTAARLPDESVRTVRVFGNCYRCNWWVQDKAPQQMWLTSGKIRKSRFVRATKTAAGLVVEDIGSNRDK